MDDSLDNKFRKAYAISSSMTEKLPPDTMLKLYAYYKQATQDSPIKNPSDGDEIRNAFKLNALLQANNISEKKAKELYIELVEKITNQKIQ